MSKYKLVPVEPTIEMAFAGIEVYGIEECADADVHSVWEAMLAAAPEVEQKPYAYEYGVSNGDGTFSVVIDKGKFTQLGENRYGYCHPGISASKEWPVTPLYLHPQPTEHRPVEQMEVVGWQPIETAPKDGTEIIVFHKEGGVCAAFCPAEGFSWHCMDGSNTVIGEKSGASIPVMTSFMEPPTHWMPLPLPPESRP